MPQKLDERLKGQLEQKLLSRGIRPPCRVTVEVSNGTVTLAGTVQFEYQKRSAVHTCRSSTKVRSVVDNLQVLARQSPWAANKKEWTMAPRKPNKTESES
jgi:osmotically-inducible protein OsmY